MDVTFMFISNIQDAFLEITCQKINLRLTQSRFDVSETGKARLERSLCFILNGTGC